MIEKGNTPDNVDLGRRWAIGEIGRKALGFTAFAFYMSHAGLAKAFESSRSQWRKVVNNLRQFATNGRRERLVTFIGTSETGALLSTTEGFATGVVEAQATTARRIFESGDRQKVAEGIKIYHTHLYDVARSRLAHNPRLQRDPRFLEVYSSPNELDISMARHGLIKTYLEMGGMSYGPIENGIVTEGGKWPLREIDWTNPANRQKYHEEFNMHKRRERRYGEVFAKLKQYLRGYPEITKETYNKRLSTDWDKVAKTPEQKLDAVVHTFLRKQLLIDGLQLATLLSRSENRDLLLECGEVQQVNELEQLRAHRFAMLTQVANGEPPERALDQFAQFVGKNFGLAMSYEPHQ